MLYHSFDRLLLLSFSYLMVKWGKPFVQIESRFQIALFFLFYRNFQLSPLIWFYLMFQAPSSPLIRTPRLFGTQEYALSATSYFDEVLYHLITMEQKKRTSNDSKELLKFVNWSSCLSLKKCVDIPEWGRGIIKLSPSSIPFSVSVAGLLSNCLSVLSGCKIAATSIPKWVRSSKDPCSVFSF